MNKQVKLNINAAEIPQKHSKIKLVTAPLKEELELFNQQDSSKCYCLGADEVAAGCLSGPLAVCAFALNKNARIVDGVRDSKKLTENKRRELFQKLTATAINVDKHHQENNSTEIKYEAADCFYSIVFVDEKEIDEINILQARMKGMTQAANNIINYFSKMNENLNNCSDVIDSSPIINDAQYQIGKILVDGNKIPSELEKSCKQNKIEIKCIIAGDDNSYAIAAASIIAKHTRDELMNELDLKYPQFGFKSNKGYGTKSHLEAIKQHGICAHHRKSFKPVSDMIGKSQ